MRIALLGYGRMGRLVEELARAEGHEIVLTVAGAERAGLSAADLRAAEVIVEFTEPSAAVANVDLALEAGVPIVVGTTGWTNELPAVTERVEARGGALFWASNFSLGVHVFLAAARRLAQLMDGRPGYELRVTETHHLGKKDAPSGTAITLAETVAAQLAGYDAWRLAAVRSPASVNPVTPASSPAKGQTAVPIYSDRLADVPGTHRLEFAGAVDTLRLEHEAHSRAGFARGALAAARWLIGKRGVFTMADMVGG